MSPNLLAAPVGFPVVSFMDTGNTKGGEYKHDEVILGHSQVEVPGEHQEERGPTGQLQPYFACFPSCKWPDLSRYSTSVCGLNK